MPTDSYPLHPDQAQPYYMTIPIEEYENLKDEISHLRILNETMRAELEKRGVIVVPPSAELDKYEKEWVELEKHGITLPMEVYNGQDSRINQGTSRRRADSFRRIRTLR